MSNQEAETSIHDQAGAGDPEVANRAREVEELRAGVDNIDAAVIHMLTERFRVTRQISHLKAEAGFAPADPGRESEQVERLRSLAQDARPAGWRSPVCPPPHRRGWLHLSHRIPRRGSGLQSPFRPRPHHPKRL